MSAFTLPFEHIDAMLTAGLSWQQCLGNIEWLKPEAGRADFDGSCEFEYRPWRELTHNHAEKIGQMLVDENWRSVNYRYRENDQPPKYQFRHLMGRPCPRVILKAIACYEYQSCECPDWEKTEAYAFCQKLRQRALSELLEGVEDAWPIEDRRIFLPPAKAIA